MLLVLPRGLLLPGDQVPLRAAVLRVGEAWRALLEVRSRALLLVLTAFSRRPFEQMRPVTLGPRQAVDQAEDLQRHIQFVSGRGLQNPSCCLAGRAMALFMEFGKSCSKALADFLLRGAPSASITAVLFQRGTSCLPVLASCPYVSLPSTWEDLTTCPTSTCWPVVPSRLGIHCA